MFIQCSACNSKYLVNSADLKPNGRMVECAACGHQWYQDPILEEDSLSPSVPITDKDNNQNQKLDEKKSKINNQDTAKVKNLPSTVVKEQKVSILNSFLVIFFLFLIIFIFLTLRSYGTNIFVLIHYYIIEFYFNLNLIINDLANIIHKIIN